MNKPLVTLSVSNCNRLHYFKSCFESLYETTKDYPNREFIVVDCASVEEGTDKYLTELKGRGVNVKKFAKRDPVNEFAHSLNFIVENTHGKYVIIMQGDQQFIVNSGWLDNYVAFAEENLNISYILLDAQRRVRIQQTADKYEPVNDSFFIDHGRASLAGAADVFFRTSAVQHFYPWNTNNEAFEGNATNSEDEMLKKVRASGIAWAAAIPKVPVSLVLHTDARGTNARVRGNKRYGDYWQARHSNGWQYYEIYEYKDIIKKFADRTLPVSIEDVVSTIGFQAPLDASGNWMKNPVRPESCSSSDYVVLCDSDNEKKQQNITIADKNSEYLDEWLND